MAVPRTKCLSTKLTDEEYAALEAKAGAQTLSTWARETLLGAGREQPAGTLAPTPAESVVVAEVLALRAILVNLHFALATEPSPQLGRGARDHWRGQQRNDA